MRLMNYLEALTLTGRYITIYSFRKTIKFLLLTAIIRSDFVNSFVDFVPARIPRSKGWWAATKVSVAIREIASSFVSVGSRDGDTRGGIQRAASCVPREQQRIMCLLYVNRDPL